MNKALSMLLATTVLFGCSDVKEKQFIAGCQSSGAPTKFASALRMSWMGILNIRQSETSLTHHLRVVKLFQSNPDGI
ncbi:hypothetical protein ACUZ8Y_01955 [Aeromonas veronii]|uniref:hypothetical protein n=1 Tax=Aeromonas veronii TaxID=654 RepID=UPI00406BDC08